MSKVIIVPIEPIDQRYTMQWYNHIPELFSDVECITIDGEQPSLGTTEGAFLDFATTNVYKSTQIATIAKKFQNGEIEAGDKFLITDAWNYAVIAIRYMSDLLDIPVEIHGIWHAGNYDPTDILGMKMKGQWASNFERSLFDACDYNYYGTDFHKNMFLYNLRYSHDPYDGSSVTKAVRSGQPHGLLCDTLESYRGMKKEDIIVWPHRYNEDKQPEIIEDLQKELDYEVVITQKLDLDKYGYYDLLGRAKMVFSCSLHENLGISMMEGCLVNAMPIVPNRASYTEMYADYFKYDSEWTSSWVNYLTNKKQLLDFINKKMVEYNNDKTGICLAQASTLREHYLNANIMVGNILRNINE